MHHVIFVKHAYNYTSTYTDWILYEFYQIWLNTHCIAIFLNSSIVQNEKLVICYFFYSFISHIISHLYKFTCEQKKKGKKKNEKGIGKTTLTLFMRLKTREYVWAVFHLAQKLENNKTILIMWHIIICTINP